MKKLFHRPAFRKGIYLILTIFIVLVAGHMVMKQNTRNANSAKNTDNLTGVKEVVSTEHQGPTSQPQKSVSNTNTITPVAISTDNDINVKVSGDMFPNSITSVDFIDKNIGWAIQYHYNTASSTDTSQLIHTTDKGVHWKVIGGEGVILKKIAFIDNKHGYAIAQAGKQIIYKGETAEYEILETKDGGNNWTVRHKQKVTVSDGYDIEVKDLKHCYVTLCGTMLRTEDGGHHWSKVSFPVKNIDVSHISFINKDKGWVIGTTSSKKIKGDTVLNSKDTFYTLYTSDAGTTWVKQFEKTYQDQWVCGIDINFVNSSTGWFFISNYDTGNGELYHTSNSGSKWKLINQIRCMRPYPQELEFITPKEGWIPLNVGAGPISGGFLHTRDGGKSFETVSDDYGIFNLDSVDFVDKKEGWASGEEFSKGAYIIHSTDGGKTWVQVYPIQIPTEDISMIDNQKGYGLGMQIDERALLKSNDGGYTWQYVTDFPSALIPKAISFADENTGWAIAMNLQSIYYILKTVDGGRTWNQQENNFNTNSNLLYFHFMNKSDGIIITGDKMSINYYRTKDGGENFSKTEEKADPAVIKYQYSYMSPENAYKIITKDKNTVEIYDKSDSNWQMKYSFQQKLWSYGADLCPNGIERILVMDQQDGRYEFLQAEDAGKRWTKLIFPKDTGLETYQNQTPIQYTDDKHGWILAKSGLLCTSDGGITWKWAN